MNANLLGRIQCTQCGWGCEVRRDEVESGDYADRQACDSCGMLMNEATKAKAERDALKQKLDELPAMYREDIESLDGCVERLGAENAKLRAEVDRLRAERRQLRARLVECLPWVGKTPFPNTPAFSEMLACRDLAKDTLEEVPE